MIDRPRPNELSRRLLPAAATVVLAALALAGVAAWAGAGPAAADAPPPALPALYATPAQVDTEFIGGYARGSFREVLPVLASGLSEAEREMVGRHLDKIYQPLLGAAGLGDGGRLRLAYERTRRSDGTTRSIQVLAAELASGGAMHTVFLFDQAQRPGYYDDMGRSLDPTTWASPLTYMRPTSGFNAKRMHPILRRVLPHLGVDYAARRGTPVYATGDGSVSYAASRGGYGNMVEVQHPNGYATRYAHLSRIAVRAGEPIQQGQVVGYVGATGLATGPHLHYEVRRKGTPVDPQRVGPGAGPGQDVGYDRSWSGERRALSSLLARAPTVVSAY